MRFKIVNHHTDKSAFLKSIKKTEERLKNELLVLEYSPSQDAMNVITFSKMIANNAEAIRKGRHPNYIPIASNHDRDNLDDAYNKFREIIDRRKEKDENRPKKDYRTQEPDLTERYNSKGPEEEYAE